MKELESIDKYLVSEIDGLENIPSENLWNSIDSKLQANQAARNTRAKKIKVISAAAVLTVAAALVMTYNSSTEKNQSVPVVITQEKTATPKNNIVAPAESLTNSSAVSENNTSSSNVSASTNKIVTTDAANENKTVAKQDQVIPAIIAKEEPRIKTEPVTSVVSEAKKDNSDKNIILLPYFAPGYTGANSTQVSKASPPSPSVNVVKIDQPETTKTDPKENTVYMPNAFTPNGDGLNDIFLPQTADTPAEYKLSVFDRSGNLVFYSDDILKGWDGRTNHNGLEEVKEDVYIWRIEMKTAKGEKRHLMGSVTLLK